MGARPRAVLATRNAGKVAELERILAPYDVELSGRRWTAVNLSYGDAEHGVVNQLHLFSGELRGPLLALVQVTATFAGSREEEQLRVVREALSTLRVGAPVPA